MKAGEVIIENGIAYVITEMRNGKVFTVQSIEEYIASNIYIKIDHETKTIKQWIDSYCTDYMNGAVVYNLDEITSNESSVGI